MTKTARRTSWISFGAILAIGLFIASPAAANKKVLLQGKHTKAEVHAACERIGGQDVQGMKPDGQGYGYGCYNPKNGILVGCNDEGGCIGLIPRTDAHVNRDLTILGKGTAPRKADPFVPPPG